MLFYDAHTRATKEESLLIGKVHLFPKFTTTITGFVPLMMILLVVMYCDFVRALHCIQDTNSYQDENPPTTLGQLLTLVWHGICRLSSAICNSWHVRCVDAKWLIFLVLHLLLIICTSSNCVALSYLWWNINKNRCKNWTSLDLVVSIRNACLLIPYLNTWVIFVEWEWLIKYEVIVQSLLTACPCGVCPLILT